LGIKANNVNKVDAALRGCIRRYLAGGNPVGDPPKPFQKAKLMHSPGRNIKPCLLSAFAKLGQTLIKDQRKNEAFEIILFE
jgi:hypothetical protein